AARGDPLDGREGRVAAADSGVARASAAVAHAGRPRPGDEDRTGDLVAVRIARTLDDLELPENEIPIIYMPEVTRQALRASDDGLGLDVAKDAKTKRSIMASLPVLADTPVSRLTGRLEAEDFDRLMVGDQPRDLLRWMSDPRGAREAYEAEGKWHAFCNRCREDYGFDPESDGELTAGERLGLHDDAAWTALWRRFCESPAAYPGIP